MTQALLPAETALIARPSPDEIRVLHEQLEKDALAEEREACENSLIEFLKRAWPHIGESGEFIINWHHEQICLPGETLIATDEGPVQIGCIVNHGWSGRVASFNHSRGVVEWRHVVRRMRSPAKRLIRIVTAGGAITCTENHPIFIVGGGYVAANTIKRGDELKALSSVRAGVSSEMPLSGWAVLQPPVCRHCQEETRKPGLSKMRKGEIERLHTVPAMLLGEQKATARIAMYALRCLSEQMPVTNTEENGHFLQCQMLRRSYAGIKQPGVHRRSGISGAIQPDISSGAATGNPARSEQMLSLPIAGPSRCAPHRPGQSAQRYRESGCALPCLSQSAEGFSARSGGERSAVVISVEPQIRLPEFVYNLEVEGNNNYFADGFLVHNCNDLEALARGEIRDLVINQPPRTSKSLVCNVAFPAWLWLQPPGRHSLLMGPHAKILSVSYGATLAEELALKMRRLVMGEWYQRLWGDRVKILSDQESRANFGNTAGGERISNSIEGGLLGRGGILQIVDDPHSYRGAESELQRQRTLEAMRSLTTRVTDPRHFARVMVMQRLHQNDCTNYALENWRADLVHRWFPMRYDETRPCPADIRTLDGELLWPEVWTEAAVAQEEKELLEYGTAGQLQQAPVPRGGGIIQRKWWRLWPDDAEQDAGFRAQYRCGFCNWSGERLQLESVVECPTCGRDAERRIVFPPTSFRLLSVDTGIGDKEINSWSAATLWGVWHGKDDAPRLMLMEAWRGRPMLRGGSTGERGLVEIIAALANRRAVDTVLIERKTRGVDLYNELGRMLRDYPWSLEYFEPKGRGDKAARLSSVQPLFTNELVWAPNKTWAEMVINEVSEMPYSKYEDLADTTSAGLIYLRDTNRLAMSHEHAAEVRRASVFRGRSQRFNASETFEGV